MKRYLLLTLLLSTYSHSFELCERMASEPGKMEIPKSCRDYIIQQNSETIRYENKMAKIYGYRNNLFIDLISNNKKNTIAGDMTLLHDIQAVDLNKDKIFILNKNSKDQMELLVFNLYNHGNIAPRQVIQIGKKNCEEMSYLSAKNSFYVKCDNELIYGKLKGDSRYTLESKKPLPLNYVELEKMGISKRIKMVSYEQQLLILDLNNEFLYSYTQESKIEKQWEVNLRTEGLNRAPASIEIEQEGFSVKDIQGEKLYYK